MATCLSIFLVLCVALGASESHAKTELHIISSFEREALGSTLTEFANSHNVDLHLNHLVSDLIKSNLLSIMEAEHPDVIITPSDQVGLHSFAKYSEIDPQLFKTKISPHVLQCGYSDGKLYGVPITQGNHLFLYYNKKLVKHPAHDWKTIFLQKAELDVKNIPTIVWPYDEPYYFLAFLSAFGGWPLSDGKVELNTPAMVNALSFYHKLQKQKIYYPDCDLTCTGKLFKKGGVAYAIGGVWDIYNFSQALGDDLGISAMPTIDGKKMLSPFSTYVIAFPNDGLNGKKRTSLIQLVDYLQSAPVQQQLWNNTKAIPIESTALKYAKDTANENMKKVLELMADTKPAPSDETMSYIWEAIRKGLLRQKEGASNAEETAIYMQLLTQRYIRNQLKQ